MRYLLPLLFLTACVDHTLIEPDGCALNTEVDQIDAEEVCFESLRCTKRGEVSFSNYMCFCDGLCLCFFSVLTDCESVYDECTSNGSMLIMSGGFCLNPDKRKILEELFNETQQIMKETSNG